MRLHKNEVGLSAHDLSDHLSCSHLTMLELAVARGHQKAPVWVAPGLEALQQRGFEHEAAYLTQLREAGLGITEIPDSIPLKEAFEQTRSAMLAGTEIISQAVLSDGRWLGRADVLKRVPLDSNLGSWAYEAVETKLARDARPGAILQLCLYSEMVADIQGISPEYIHIVSPGTGYEAKSFRLSDFQAYYRYIKRNLITVVDGADDQGEISTYPDPVTHCDICRWRPACNRRRRSDDHLSLVAGISRLQIAELQERGVETLTRLAGLPLPFAEPPRRGSQESYLRIREQARVQLESRGLAVPVVEVLDIESDRGLCLLPPPSRGDIFFDIEGDAFVGEHGLEYLFGYVFSGSDQGANEKGLWAFSPAEEKKAFEEFIDDVMERWALDPGMHVYHYAPYEPVALKRLMGRYATRQSEVDRLLRAERFVDLYSIVRQAVRAGIERYSLKDLEVFYSFERDLDLPDANKALHAMELALEMGHDVETISEIHGLVARYNLDDCISTLRLRDWLELLRAEVEGNGTDVPRPEEKTGDPSEQLDERQQAVEELKAKLIVNISVDEAERSCEEHAHWLLAHILEWHWREEKPQWWEYFRLLDLDPDDLVDERAAISGLVHLSRTADGGRNPIDRYQFPRQDTDIRSGDQVRASDDTPLGTVIGVDLGNRTIDVRKSAKALDHHPVTIVTRNIVRTTELADSLMRLGALEAESRVDSPNSHPVAMNLLCRRPPAALTLHRQSAAKGSESTLTKARQLAIELNNGVLAIQGPPGSGKTFTGARMICELVKAGKKVGITSNSHKVIENLLTGVVLAAAEENIPVSCIQKVSKSSSEARQGIRKVSNNAQVHSALEQGTVQVAAGTAWLWARPEFAGTVDVLFVDEAGQMSLANVLAIAQSTKGIVLLGDPQQLQQPQQGSHPFGTEVSALEHLLGEEKTIATDQGIFLGETWRLHPSICGFTSELFYENRLSPRSDLGTQALVGDTPFAGAGLWYSPVNHEGNRNSSIEEALAVKDIVDSLLRDDTAWTDRMGQIQPLTLKDILVVAPYNAQVAEISEIIPGARVGTVDRFQGQEAPVVIYSLATSSPDEVPRGMEFLYNLNRFNVAVSRARCVCILVGSPKLFETECRSPRQMRLANTFCRYLELARIYP